MKTTKPVPFLIVRRGPSLPSLLVAVAVVFTSIFELEAAQDPAAQKLIDEARAKEVHAQQLRAAAAATLQKAADDQMEASADEREARILNAQALKLMGADENKQKAFKARSDARKFATEAHNMMVYARNAEQKSAQLSHNADELRKAAAQLKDQAGVASTLESEAKDASNQAQIESQTASNDKVEAQKFEDRARALWVEAEKLDPETHRQVAPATPKPQLVQPRQVR